MEIHLLTRKKTAYELLLDLEKIFIIKIKQKNGKFKRKGSENLADILGVNKSVVTRWLNYGIPEKVKNKKELEKNIKEAAKTFEVKTFINVSPVYSHENIFTQKSFKALFKNVRNTKLKNNERFIGQAGLRLQFNNRYIIPCLVVTTYDSVSLRNCLDKLGEEIEERISKFNSLTLFYFIFLKLEKVKTKEL